MPQGKIIAARRAALALALSLLPARAPAPSAPAADAAQVRWDAQVGLDESLFYAAPGAFNPFRIDLSNTLADFRGTLRVVVTRAEEFRHRQSVVLALEQPLELPRDSRKSLHGLFLCDPDDTELEVHLITESGEDFIPPILVGFSTLDLRRRAVLAVSSTRGDWEVLRTSPDSITGLARQVLHCRPENVPSHWAALAPASTIIWDGERWPVLDPAQTAALRTWLERGGVLAAGTGSQWPQLAESPLAPLVPVRLGETQMVSAEAATGPVPLRLALPLALASLDEASLPPGARVLSSLAGRPLLVTWPVGRGHVVLSTAALAPLWAAARQQHAMLASLIVPARAPDLPRPSAGPFLQAASASIASVSRVNIPEAATIGSWLALLWVLLVPANFAFARMVRRPGLAWWLAPMLAVAATGAIYRRGILGALPYQTVQQTHFALCEPGAGHAQVQGLVTIYSPVGDAYTVTVHDPQAAIAPLQVAPGMAGVSEVYRFTVGGAPSLVDFPMGFETLRSLSLETAIPSPISAPIRATLAPGGQSVDLHWDADLTGAAGEWIVLWNGSAWALDEDALGAGRATLRGVEGRRLAELWAPPPADEDENVTVTVLSHLVPALEREVSRRWPIALLGVRDEALTPLSVSTRHRPQASGAPQRLGMAMLIVPALIDPWPSAPGPHEWALWHSTLSVPEGFGYDLVNDFQANVLLEGPLDLAANWVPQSPAWRRLLPRRLDVTLSVAGAANRWGGRGLRPAQSAGMRPHLALFDWLNTRWHERTGVVAPQQVQISWSDPKNFLHPLTGEILAAAWVTASDTADWLANDPAAPTDPHLGPPRTRDMSRAGDSVSLTLTIPRLSGGLAESEEDTP